MPALECLALIGQATAAAAQDPATLWVIGGVAVGLPLATLGFALAGNIRRKGKEDGSLHQRVSQVEKSQNELWECHRSQEVAIGKIQQTTARIDERTRNTNDLLKQLIQQRRNEGSPE